MSRILKIIIFTVLIISILWICLTLYEFNRVKNGNKPLLCFNQVSETESLEESSKTCYGIFYKYKEYYMQDTATLKGKEFTLFFKDFERNINN